MEQPTINTERLERVMGLSLKHGGHNSPGRKREFEACVMEAVAYVAGEAWSDHPQCACPVITAFMVSWNDLLPSDADRDRLLKPLIPRLVGTRSTAEIAERRSYMALDWLIRVHTPKFLDLVPALASHAKALRDLDEIVDLAGATAAGKLTAAAWAAAWAVAGAAAWAAAWAVAGAAAGAAAWAAAGAAAGAAARAAAWDAAGAAAWAAAWAAAGAALNPTVEWLQVSALNLVDRMIAAQDARAA